MPIFLLVLLAVATTATLVFRIARGPLRDDALADGDRIWRSGTVSQRATRALAAAMVRTGVQVEGIRVLADWEAQALTVAGRRGDQVLVSAGALATLTPAELSALIAHELGHVAGRHLAHETNERALRLAALAGSVVLLILDVAAGLVVSVAVLVVSELLLRLELRRHERDADVFAARAGLGVPLARALEKAEVRDRRIAEVVILLSRAQVRTDPLSRAVTRPIERRWGGAAPTGAELERWSGRLRAMVGQVTVAPHPHRYDGLREVHEPVGIRARRLRRPSRR
jgi:Zn-dependent protease with chaperone function